MLGFLKRDLSLQAVNAKFYLCFVLAFLGISVFNDHFSSFATLYLVIFSGTSIMSLFSYDEANHWEAYAAAVPKGRKTMVDARYLLALGIGAAVFLFQLLVGLLTRSDQLGAALLYTGALLLYAAVILPISYRFGGTRARVVMVVAVAAISALVALVATSAQIFANHASSPMPPAALSALLPLAGLAALALSWRLSRAIMARKEL